MTNRLNGSRRQLWQSNKKGWPQDCRVSLPRIFKQLHLLLNYWRLLVFLFGCSETVECLYSIWEMRIASFGVFTGVRTKCLKLMTALEHVSAQFPNQCGLYPRDREIPARRVIPESTERSPEVRPYKVYQNSSSSDKEKQ
jgi:hypothetical protein